MSTTTTVTRKTRTLPPLMTLTDAAADRLRALGIPLVHDSPGVGENLHDHLQIRMQYKVHGVRTLNERVNSPNVKLVCDLYHLQIMDGDIAQNIRDTIKWIAHFHTAGVPSRNEIDFSQEMNYRYIAEVIAGRVEVCVRDDGPGIALADQPYLFDRYFQSRPDVAPATGEGGRGLGLAIVKRIVELHGGEVRLQSAPGVGTRVTLVVPAARPSETR